MTDIDFGVAEEELLYGQECYKIIGACMEVHSELGPGFAEAVYEEALGLELLSRKIPFERQRPLVIHYKGQELVKRYYADFVCHDKIILEIKAANGLISEHMAQVLNYLKATESRLGLLVNFGTNSLQYKRIIK